MKDNTQPRVRLSALTAKFGIENLTTELDLEEHFLTSADINRPALQLTGFWENFAPERIQIIGKVEYSYLKSKSDEERLRMYEELIFRGIPCLLFSRSMRPSDALIKTATEKNVPILLSEHPTAYLESEIIRWLHVQLAPMISIHGVLMDVYGEGVLITGESGIGKSEAAIELIKRGHRLVADDVVEIRRVSEDTLVGSAPEVTRHLIELRGIGIIDVRMLFGVGAVKNTQSISLVIQLEDWRKEAIYDRIGSEEQYMEFLGNEIPCHHLPVRPGRNLAVIVECAAVNYRQKRMGYNAADELYRRVQRNMSRRDEDVNDLF
ncbi:MAG: HPr(Ser) kinase/phosphatase [Lachnospiraceae bacterium]|nr:HPr(Ser) kinase/phosphatase [Lachnospiraceae bacterium]